MGMMKPREIKKLQARSRRLHAQITAENTVVVSSRTDPYSYHVVTIKTDSDGTLHAKCTCPWGVNGGHGCSHVMAALTLLAERQKRTISFWHDREEAERQKHRILRLAGSQQDSDIYITSRSA